MLATRNIKNKQYKTTITKICIPDINANSFFCVVNEVSQAARKTTGASSQQVGLCTDYRSVGRDASVGVRPPLAMESPGGPLPYTNLTSSTVIFNYYCNIYTGGRL